MKHYFHALHVSFYHVHHAKMKNNGDAVWRLHADDVQYHSEQDLLQSEGLETCLSYQRIYEEKGRDSIRYYVPIPLVKSDFGMLVFDVDEGLNNFRHEKLEKVAQLFRNCDAHLTAFHHDVLTGLGNRMALNEVMKRQLLKHQKKHRRRGEN